MTTPPPPYEGTGDQHPDQHQGYGATGYPGAPAYSGGPATNEVDNSLGVIVLITGLVGLFPFPPVAIAGIIFGRKSIAAANAGRATNGSLRTAGFVLGIIGTVLLFFYALIVVASVLFLL